MRKILLLLLTFMFTAQLIVFAVGAPIYFSDTKDHWAVNEIAFMAQIGVVNGYDDAGFSFLPNDYITRAEFIKILFDLSGDETIPPGLVFIDIMPHQWFASYVSWASGNGIVKGYDDMDFRPNNTITRQEMAVMINNFIEYKKLDLKRYDAVDFIDIEGVAPWSRPQLERLSASYVINGLDGGYIRPENNATRAEATTLLYNLCILSDGINLFDMPEKDEIRLRLIQRSEENREELKRLKAEAAEIAKRFKRVVFGKSVMGRDLYAYQIDGKGRNDKLAFAIFTQHGWEDDFPRDGQALVDCAERLAIYYRDNPEQLHDFRLIIIPLLNPDGLIDGVNAERDDGKEPFGRCTAAGVDLNRDWGAGRFKAIESRSLLNYINSFTEEKIMLLDFHGYLDGYYGSPVIGAEFATQFDMEDRISLGYFAKFGYLMGYASETLGIPHVALIEFKDAWSADSVKTSEALNRLFKKL